MRSTTVIVGLVASVLLAGCAGSKKEALAPENEVNVWADYKGTFAQPAEPAAAKPEPVAAKPEPSAASTSNAAAVASAAPTPAPAKKSRAKKATKAPGKKAAVGPRAKS